MRGVRSRPGRAAARWTPATVGALALHAVLITALTWRQAPPAPVAERVVSIQLVDLRPERRAVEKEPVRPALRPESARRTAPTRPATIVPLASSNVVAAPPVVDSAARQPGLSREALGRILSGATACDPGTIDRLPAKERADCARRVLEAGLRTGALMPKGARRYERMYEHVEIMGDVRRAENGGERGSCNARRNLDPTCANYLPDNLPKDYRLPDD